MPIIVHNPPIVFHPIMSPTKKCAASIIFTLTFAVLNHKAQAQTIDLKLTAAISKISEVAQILATENHAPISKESALSVCITTIDPIALQLVSPQAGIENQLAFALKKIESEKLDKAIDSCINAMVAISGSTAEYKPAPAVGGTPAANLGGIGVDTQAHSNGVQIVNVYSNAPAQVMGLKPSDIVTSINGVSLVGLPLQEAISLFKGALNSSVSVSVIRAGLVSPIVFQGKREKIQQETLVFRDYPDALYVRYHSFSEGSTLKALAQGLDKRRNEKLFFKQLIIDLRYCTGGEFSTLIELIKLHVGDQATLLKVQKKDQLDTITASNARFNHSAASLVSSGHHAKNWADQLRTVPIVVLVNNRTASGAEVFAAALKDNNRAKIMGEKTAGFANLDTVKYVDDSKGFLRLTTAHMLRANGEQLHGVGLIPDIVLTSKGASITGINDIDIRDLWLESALAQVAR
jgi:carboxyl-terminal processing protease